MNQSKIDGMKRAFDEQYEPLCELIDSLDGDWGKMPPHMWKKYEGLLRLRESIQDFQENF